MILPAAVYTAYHGYAWSNEIEGVPVSQLNHLYRYIAVARGAFPDPINIDVGFVSDGTIAAAFTIQNIEHWDSEQRASDYAAFAIFPVSRAADIDFVELINRDFFWQPTRDPLGSIEYSGPKSTPVPYDAMANLALAQKYHLKDPHAIGSLIANFGTRSSRWVGLMKAENTLQIECDHWNQLKD